MVNWWPIVIKHLPFCIHYHFKSFNCDEFIALIRTIDSSGAEGVILIPSKFATRSFVCAKYCLFLYSRRKNVVFEQLQTNSWVNTFWLYKHFIRISRHIQTWAAKLGILTIEIRGGQYHSDQFTRLNLASYDWIHVKKLLREPDLLKPEVRRSFC